MSFNFGVSTIAFINNSFPSLNYTYSDSVITLICTAIGYTLLAFYLEQVLPNSQGTNKHPLFFLKNLCKSRRRHDSQNQALLSEV
jgi:hypothetical protein